MKIADIRLQRYDLKLSRPLMIKGHILSKRSGLIISIIDSEGRIAYGEIAPLPFLHKETLEESVCSIMEFSKIFVGADIQESGAGFYGLSEFDKGTDLPSSVLFGVEMALFDLYLQYVDHIDLGQLNVPVCGLVNSASPNFYSEVKDLLEQRFSAIKIKVGLNSIAEDIDKIKASKEMFQSNIKLRLDANRSWTLKEAIAFCDQVGSEKIEYIEEPVKQICDQKMFVDQTGFPLALDETLLENSTGLVYDFGHVSAFILKPGLVGGFSETDGLIKTAHRNHIKPVLSSSFQSGLSIRSMLLFAGFEGLSSIPAGLDTLKWFVEDCYAYPIPVINGTVHLESLLKTPLCLNEKLLTYID